MLVLFIALRAPGLVFFRANSETPRHSSERLQVDLCWFPSFPRLVYLAAYILRVRLVFRVPRRMLAKETRGRPFSLPPSNPSSRRLTSQVHTALGSAIFGWSLRRYRINSEDAEAHPPLNLP